MDHSYCRIEDEDSEDLTPQWDETPLDNDVDDLQTTEGNIDSGIFEIVDMNDVKSRLVEPSLADDDFGYHTRIKENFNYNDFETNLAQPVLPPRMPNFLDWQAPARLGSLEDDVDDLFVQAKAPRAFCTIHRPMSSSSTPVSSTTSTNPMAASPRVSSSIRSAATLSNRAKAHLQAPLGSLEDDVDDLLAQAKARFTSSSSFTITSCPFPSSSSMASSTLFASSPSPSSATLSLAVLSEHDYHKVPDTARDL